MFSDIFHIPFLYLCLFYFSLIFLGKPLERIKAQPELKFPNPFSKSMCFKVFLPFKCLKVYIDVNHSL